MEFRGAPSTTGCPLLGREATLLGELRSDALDDGHRLAYPGREESKRAQSESAKELHLAAKRLREQNLSLRDIGQVLGVSYQRAHRLVSSA